ncbi:MAG TPA: PRC-barrel domain-containing protein [Stellaceae bacterium]
MLWRSSDLDGYEIAATDGPVGSVDDMLFEEARWTVRWLVVDTGGRLIGRQVLLSPEALGHPDAAYRRIPANLTRRQVEDSPPFAGDRPLSRDVETSLYDYYGWTPYWDADLFPPIGYLAGGIGGGYLVPPGPEARDPAADAAGYKPGSGGELPDRSPEEPELRSLGDMMGYAIRATDGDIGHAEDFLIDDEGWRIRYMVVDTRNWLPGRKVLVSPHWIRDVDWLEQRVHVDLTRRAIENSPPYDPSRPLDRAYEAELHGHYGREDYWPVG